MAENIEAQAGALRTQGAELGRDLACAFILATVDRPADRDAKRQMGQIVLREISAAVRGLRDAGLAETLVAAFDSACRQACREQLLAALPADAAARQAA